MNKNDEYEKLVDITIAEYVARHMRWSMDAFGEGDHLEGLLTHIEKEVAEVREVAGSSKELALKELVDIIILTIDAMWRLGPFPDEIALLLVEKQAINMRRKWPKITDNSLPTEHIKEDPFDLSSNKHVDDFRGEHHE